MNLQDALTRLPDARPCAGGWVARCPAHDDRRPSLSIREGDGGKSLLYCYAGCSYESIIAALCDRPWREALGPASPGTALDDAQRREIARRIWRESRPATGTLAETYLRSRAITIAPPASLRFHPALKHPTGAIAPAMVGGVQDRAGNPIALHRTYLAPDGLGKANVDPPKMAFGPIRGGAVRLAPAGEVLALAEGIETALSVQQATSIPVWATLGTANLAGVELPEIVRTVIIAADGDDAGERASQQAAQRFLREGKKVRIARPPTGKDFNDVVMESDR
jgi:putative DNA primase/helicase